MSTPEYPELRNLQINPTLFENLSSLEEKIHYLQKSIKQAHDIAFFRNVLYCFQKFIELKYEDKEWKEIAIQINAYRWSSRQSYKDLVGGHLFYPSNINKLLESHYTEKYLKRNDYIWTLAIATYFKHTLAQYYLARVIGKNYAKYQKTRFTGKRKPLIIEILSDHSILELKKHNKNPDALYILGVIHSDDLTIAKFVDLRKAHEYHESASLLGDLRNRFEAFRLRVSYRHLFKETKYVVTENNDEILKKYEEMGDLGYGPAYIEAFEYILNTEKINSNSMYYLDKALEDGPHYFAPALMVKADYLKTNNIDQAMEYYLKAGEKGIPKGYLKASQLLIGNLDFMSKKQFKIIPEEKISLAISYLNKACEFNYPSAFTRLGKLYKKLYDLYSNKEYLNQFYETVDNGISVGSNWAYSISELLYKDYDTIENTYGLPTDDKNFYKLIESFLEKDWSNR